MQKNIILILILIISTPNLLISQNKALKLQNHILNESLNKLKADKDFKNALISFYAIDTKTNEIIAENNSDLTVMPASTQKLFSTSAALEIIGKNYRFTTSLQYSGKIDVSSKVLTGNIYIKGGGDPTLGSKYFNKNNINKFIDEWINAIKKLGIKSINGRIIGDASIYSTDISVGKWAWEDVGNYYAAGANGLSVFDNLYEIHLQSPKNPNLATKIINIEPQIPNIEIINEVLSSNIRSDEAFIFGAPYRNLHIIRGTIPKAKNDFVIKGSIPDPAYYIAWLLQQKLDSLGIKCTKSASTIRLKLLEGDTIKSFRKTIHIHYSNSLSEIINITNKKSINLFAEHLLNHIGFISLKEGSNNSGQKALSDFWKAKGMDTDGLYLYDGSGLSRFNGITAKQMVFVLNYMKNKSNNFETFYSTLPVAGISGTLKSNGKSTSAENNVHAKSGSIGRVRAYAGYVTTKSGRELAFSMNISNYNCSSSEARNKLTELMIAMADFNL
ncbi:MAG: D-alanyl-D-alanine carboxypeptidase/D-alanyl-D-alanine-endopeptidase [Bacteroidales bacterium]|nr:D-alanyl-D-alanine carboxypeptidase/D-alanyl-D-alanine-endopeptidase [Bacteroidales bacterium]MBN2756912.1 D-alanyl-D-alanine carboxypeptidase/D-alanyl-D-alanine-endopeptidase [Bacteroidales bacterium]